MEIDIRLKEWHGWKNYKVGNFVKIFFVLFGEEALHKFDKKVFSYFIDDTAATAIVPYRDVFFDKCGARDRNSWIAKRYLYEKGIDINSDKLFKDL